MSKTFFDISPVNNAEFYGWSAGLPLIRFNLANTDTTITKLKLQGELIVMDTTTNLPVQNPTSVFQMNQRSGAGSLLNQITVSSAKQSQQLESIRACHRLSVALNSQMNNDDDFVNNLCYELAPNNKLTQRRMITAGTSVGGDTALNNQRKRCHFSIELNSGILQSLLASGGINLSENLFGGLILELELNNSKTLLFGAAANTDNYEVRIYRPKLRGSSIMDLPPEMMNQTNATEFFTWSSFYSVINSSEEQINLNLGMSSVISAFTNFIPTANTNSYLVDSGSTNNLVGESKVVYSKAGRRHPYNFNVEAQPTSSATALSRTPLNQVCRNYASAFDKYSERESDHSIVDYERMAQATAEQPRAGGIGMRLDSLSSQGEAYQNVSLEFSLSSDEGVGATNPMALYTFVLNRNMLQSNQNQIVVVR